MHPFRPSSLACALGALLTLAACHGGSGSERPHPTPGHGSAEPEDEDDPGSRGPTNTPDSRPERDAGDPLGSVDASDASKPPPGEPVPGEPVPGDNAEDFISHVPGQSSPGGGGGLGGASATGSADAGASTPATDGAGGAAQRAIAEADILHRDGDRLYALSRYVGLSVVDIADPKQLKLLGTHRSNAEPFEMYVRNGVAYVLYNNYTRYEFDTTANGWVYHSQSQIRALNVADPAHISVIGEQPVPGSISDSRLVGDVLYLVTFENGYCYSCATKPNTRVASFSVANPAHFEKLDELRFEEQQQGSYQRSISVTTERIYVGGPTWQDRDSNIQVVDIADAAGKLALGATIPIHGSVASRWQMDEYQGVLRVISQPTAWRTNDPPYVQTFRVLSSTQVTPLASVAVRLPRPESLQSVRFDGARAYAVTFQRTDPLFTFDLSEPSRPRQVGELEIPGFVYHMEPRGNRIYALGFDNAASAGSLHVSIFDVSNLSAPSMLDRVNFGGTWASLAEDQDRIQKAFNILLDQGLILVPFSGGKYDQDKCHYTYLSGIQLIDAAGDDLTLRGVAPQVGSARRSFLHREHLFGITDNALSVFDIRNRDQPLAVDQLEVARNIAQVRVMGDTLLRFGTDWWTNRSIVDFTTLDASSTAEPLGELDLASVIGGETTECQNSAYWDGQLYVHGNVAYAPRRQNRYYTNANGLYQNDQTLTLYIVDLSNRSAPKLVGTLSSSADGTKQEWLGGVVITDHALLIGRGTGYYSYYPQSGTQPPKYAYDVYDLRDPLKPALTKRFEVPSRIAGGGWGWGFMGCGMDMGWGFWFPSYGSTSALVSGDLVVSQHEEDVNDGSGRVRYYLDRLDVSDPASPRLLTQINIPGQVVHFEGTGQRLVTLEYLYSEKTGLTWEQCYAQGAQSYLDPSQVCRTYRKRANALVLEGDTARRVSMVDLDSDERNSGSIAVSAERLFVTTHSKKVWSSNAAPQQRLESFAFAQSGQLTRLVPLDFEGGLYWGTLYARGARAFTSSSGRLSVVDTRAATPTIKHHDMQGWGCSSLEVQGDRAYCALGQYGVFTVDL